MLGIFGREGLDLAPLWAALAANDPGAFTFRMYRNFNRQGAAFGDTSERASSADQGQLAIYAARRGSDGALTLMIINKSAASLTSQITLAGFTSSGFSATFPASSITLMVLPKLSVPLTLQAALPLVRR